MTEPSLTAPVPNASLWEDFIDIFVSPSTVFRRRENSGFGIQLLVLTVIFALIVLGTKSLMQPMMDAEFARQAAKMMQAHPEIPAEQLQRNREIGEKFGPFLVIFVIPIAALLTGVVLWLVGKILESKQTATQAMMVATYAFFPKVLGAVAGAIIAYVSDPARLNGAMRLTVGPGAFLDPDKTSPVLLALLGRLDVFTIWVTVLLAIGLHVTGKVPKAQAYLAAAIVWFIGALPGLLGALRS